ncbi:MAG: helix-turn-helix transcriptional regulator [Ruminococcaceae bacterium]|nr:helix-turn-helix transcriptional regulator [Oscillospiraceae bacterium]
MEINLKDTLKSLRLQKNITQETLAEYLGITQQSVGKWERGEGFPDITLLPKLALYFNVSIDDLLNVGQARIEDRIHTYTKQAEIYEKNGDINARIALWEQAHNEFPNNAFVMERLNSALFVNMPYPYPQETANRIIHLATRILDTSTDIKLRESAIFSLCTLYESMGDTEKALYYADMCSSMYYCRESMRAGILKGEEGIKEAQSCLLHYVFCASQEAITMPNHNFNCEEEIKAIQLSIDLLDLLLSDGNYGGYAADMSWRYSLLACNYAQIQNKEKALQALEKCVEFSIIDAKKTEGFYTAPMVNRLEHGKNFSKNFKGNACNARIQKLSLPCFDFLRDHERFKECERLLNEYAEKI